jgi:hypothetical protein
MITARVMGPGRDGEESETAENEDRGLGRGHQRRLADRTKGASIKGQVSFDTQQPGNVKPSSIGLWVMPKDPAGSPGFFMGPGNRDTLNDDWTFEMRAMRGPVLLRTGRTPPGYSLKAVYYNNQDVTDSGINFKPGESLSGVQVVLTAKSSTVSGSVTDARSQPVTDYAAIIFAEDSAKWGYMSAMSTWRARSAGRVPGEGAAAGTLPRGGCGLSRRGKRNEPGNARAAA